MGFFAIETYEIIKRNLEMEMYYVQKSNAIEWIKPEKLENHI